MMLYSTHAWDLVWALESASSPPCNTPATSIQLTPSARTIIQKETKNPEERSNSQQIVSYCLGLHTQNPGLREVDLELSPNRGSDKINRLRPRRKNTAESKLYHTAWTHKQAKTKKKEHNRKQVASYSLDSQTGTQHLER